MTKNISLTFFIFTFLNLLEKFIAYIAPLLVLRYFNNNEIYNKIEIIYSFALIANVFLDFGVKGHFVYKYRFLTNNINKHFNYLYAYNSLILFYIIIFLFIFSLAVFFKLNYFLFTLFFIRFLYLFIINFFRIFFRFYFNINYYFLLSLPILFLTIIILFTIYKLKFNYYITYFFLSSLILIALYPCFYFINKKFFMPSSETLIIIKKSFIYYWPILVSSAISLLILNFVKIYSFYSFDNYSTTKISFYLRLLMIIQLSHATFSSFFLKKNFSNISNIINLKTFSFYLLLLCASTLFVIIIFDYSSVFFNLNLSIDKVFFILMFYILMWCIGAYFEQFLSKINKNFQIMIGQILSLIIYFSSQMIFNKNLIGLSYSMALSALFYFIIIVYFLNKNNIKIK